MKWLTRTIASFVAGIFFLGGLTLIISWLNKSIINSYIGLIGFLITLIAVYLFFVGYKGKLSF